LVVAVFQCLDNNQVFKEIPFEWVTVNVEFTLGAEQIGGEPYVIEIEFG